MIPPPHPKPAVNISILFFFMMKSIDENSNFSYETTRMLKIQGLTLHIADKMLASSSFLSFGMRVPTFHADVSPVYPDLRKQNRSR